MKDNAIKCWQANWIIDPRFSELNPINLLHKASVPMTVPTHPEELQNQHMLVRKVFVIDKFFKKAQLDITADDYYILYINNVRVGQGPAPGYPFHYNYNQYDLSHYLQTGKNIIAADVYYQGLINRAWNSGDYRQGLIAELTLDGRKILGTDTSWKFRINTACIRGPIASPHNTQFLEYIDARLLPRNWQEITFDDSHWASAVVNKSDNHNLYLQITPVKQNSLCRPMAVHQFDDGHYLADFGEELTGTFTARAKGTAGEIIEIRYGEELDDTGKHVRYQLRCQCLYQDKWILSGEADNIEFFEYKGFRYVEIFGPGGTLRPDSFAVRTEHYPFDETATTFECDHDLLNQIWTICKRAVRNGSQENYVDCPTREKGQYLGDALITAHSQIYLTGDVRMLNTTAQEKLKKFACE